MCIPFKSTDHDLRPEEACARQAGEVLVALSAAGIRAGPYWEAAFGWEERVPGPDEQVWIERRATLGSGFEVRGGRGFLLQVQPPRPERPGGRWGAMAHVTVFVRFDPTDPARASRLHAAPAARLAAAGLRCLEEDAGRNDDGSGSHESTWTASLPDADAVARIVHAIWDARLTQYPDGDEWMTGGLIPLSTDQAEVLEALGLPEEEPGEQPGACPRVPPIGTAGWVNAVSQWGPQRLVDAKGRLVGTVYANLQWVVWDADGNPFASGQAAKLEEACAMVEGGALPRGR